MPDVLGILVLAATVAAILAAIVQGHAWGWSGARILGLIAAGVLGLAFTVWRALRHPAPVIEPAILRIRAVALGNVAALVFFGGVGAMIFTSTLFLTGMWGHSVLRASMEIAPGPLTAAALAVPGGLLAARYGPRVLGLVGGAVFAAGGIWWVVAIGSTPDYASAFLPGSIIGGIGFGLLLPCLATAATMSLPPERFATGTAMTAMCRQIGFALGVAVVAAVLDGRPDVAAFHSAFLIMAICGLTAGVALLAIGSERQSAPAYPPLRPQQGTGPAQSAQRPGPGAPAFPPHRDVTTSPPNRG